MGLILGDFIDHFYEAPLIELKDNHGKMLYRGDSYKLPLEYDDYEIKELVQGEYIGVTVWT